MQLLAAMPVQNVVDLPSLLLLAFQFLQDHLQARLELPFGAGLAFGLGVFSVVFDRAAVKIGSFG